MNLKNDLMNETQKIDRPIWASLFFILIIGFFLRLLWNYIVNPSLEGGDGPFYLELAQSIVSKLQIPDSWWNSIGPIYPVFLSFFYLIFPSPAVISAVRITQSVFDCATCIILFDIARRIFNTRIAIITAAITAIDLRFITQTSDISTETLFIFFMMLGIWIFIITRTAITHSQHEWLGYAGMTVVLLFASFIRPILLPIPFLLLTTRLIANPTRSKIILFSSLTAFAIIILGSWTFYKYQTTGNWVIISDGLTGNFWLGSHGNGKWLGYTKFSEDLVELLKKYNGRYAYLEDAIQIITANPSAYIRLLAIKLSSAYLQPYGTVAFASDSFKEMSTSILRGEVNLLEMIRLSAFLPKLIIYIFHFFGLIGGVIGIYLSRRDWLKVSPLLISIIYFTITYTLLTIIPRYIFPIMPFYMIFAIYALDQLLLTKWQMQK